MHTRADGTAVDQGNGSLHLLSGERDVYLGYDIIGIDCTPEFEKIEFENQEVLHLGKSMGDIPEDTIKLAQIRRTIEIHLDKELMFLKKNIKVLSLFFIDKVEKYRLYNDEDSRGTYAKMFEDCYNELIHLEKYKPILDKFPFPTEKVHDGYFSKDSKGKIKNTKGDDNADISTYNTIMKDKEWLLSFECPLRFIFSHSTLKEGWDNPNVFQVCTLIDNKNVFTCRQKIGRGLRLPVDTDGNRIEDKNINVLHIVANESFAEFASTLQKEIEQETGYKFGVLEIGLFVDIDYENDEGITVKTNYDDAMEIMAHLEKHDYVSKNGTVSTTLKNDLLNGTLNLPKKFENAKERFASRIKQTTKTVPVRNDANRVSVKLKKQVLNDDPKFKELWDKIKQKTMYRINIEDEQLIDACVQGFKELPKIQNAKVVSTTTRVNIKDTGVSGKELITKTMNIEEIKHNLPDILRILQDECKIPKYMARDILFKSNRLSEFMENPQKFVEETIHIIKNARYTLDIKGIKYTKLDGVEYTYQEIFDSEELIGYLDKNAVAVDHSVYDHVIYDSDTVELPFATALDNNEDVKMFFKIPDKFKKNTPIGTYNPDWAIYVENNDIKKMFFVIETKGSTNKMDLRIRENMKIHCGEEHFKALDGAEMKLAKDWKSVKVGL